MISAGQSAFGVRADFDGLKITPCSASILLPTPHLAHLAGPPTSYRPPATLTKSAHRIGFPWIGTICATSSFSICVVLKKLFMSALGAAGNGRSVSTRSEERRVG